MTTRLHQQFRCTFEFFFGQAFPAAPPHPRAKLNGTGRVVRRAVAVRRTDGQRNRTVRTVIVAVQVQLRVHRPVALRAGLLLLLAAPA